MLVDDPCSLLMPIDSTSKERWVELAKDQDGADGISTERSRCEARLALKLEALEVVPGQVSRPPKGDVLDRQVRSGISSRLGITRQSGNA